jgi:hypothetical protein
MRKPSVFVLGVQKCGTTTIADLLDLQPEIFVPAIKETYFFCDDSIFALGVSHWLKDHYQRSDADLLCDATPFHLASEEALRRIAEFVDDDTRFIVALRDPVARAYSAYWHQCRNGNETLGFEDALEQETDRIAVSRAKNGRWWRHAYVEVGRYDEQLDRAFDLLGRDRFLIVSEPDLRDLTAMQAKLRAHLGLLARAEVPDLARSNQAGMPRSRLLHSLIIKDNPVKRIVQKAVPRQLRTRVGRSLIAGNLKRASNPPMSAETQRRLYADFAQNIERLAAMNVCDVSHWQARQTENLGV